MALRVCLIVDNPLRDLDGLVLVAWQLAQKGVEAYLVPMYNQAFDVIALAPDIVLVNYARPQNEEQLWRYHVAGIRIGVLDTEGSPGRDIDGFADMVKRISTKDFVELYCLWGLEQYDVFIKHKVLPEKNLKLTGCPRYDYCVEPLRKALPIPQDEISYILINTSFPLANPRFTSGSTEELETMIKVGYEPAFAERVVNDSISAYSSMIEVLSCLANKFPEQKFIIRPHPFESLKAYKQLEKLDNIELQQKGTSLEWIDSAKVLIHLNCITAVEAVMLNVEVIALEWINTPALLAQSPPLNVSLQAKNQEDLESLVQEILEGKQPYIGEELSVARNDIIQSRYFKNDGNAARRITDAIYKVITSSDRLERKSLPRFNLKPTVMHMAKMIFGYKLFHFLKRRVQGSKNDMRIAAKLFTLEQVNVVLQRINNAYDEKEVPPAYYAAKSDMIYSRYASGQVVKVCRVI